jgi:hypothetical protein
MGSAGSKADDGTEMRSTAAMRARNAHSAAAGVPQARGRAYIQ